MAHFLQQTRFVMRLPHRIATSVATLSVLLAMPAARPSAAQTISDERLFAQSFDFAQEALRLYGAHDDVEQLRRVTQMGFELVEVSGFRDYPFTFHLIDMPVPNAFALPGGQIFLTRGMLRMNLTDDELANLLGHEIGHVIERHGIRTQKKARLLNVLGQALVIGILANEVTNNRGEGRNDPYYDPYSGSDSQAASRVQGAAAASLVTSELLLRSYSREFEDEADSTGQRLAALAGYDPAGTSNLMNKMRVQIPQTKEYGFWLTHPFFDQRVQNAEVRRANLTTAATAPDTGRLRANTQRILLDWAASAELDEDALEYARTVALHTWPIGETADGIRLAKLHELRDTESELAALARDYTRLIETYEREIADLDKLSPASDLIQALRREALEFARRRGELYPRAVEVLEGRVYETGFLETFISNYPESELAPQVALELGEAYSRLSRQAEAVSRFLYAWEVGPETEQGRRAHRGLLVLAGRLESLAALERLASESDSEVARRARARLGQLAPSFSEVETGAAYLDAYPEGPHAESVTARLNHLADDLYGEVVLYQTVGDAAKAVTGIQRILTHAPFSPAADRLRRRMVLES